MQESPVFTSRPSEFHQEKSFSPIFYDLAIVIVNYNTLTLLRACLKSVFASRCNFQWRVFVVDNNSKDGSARMVREEFEGLYENLTLLETFENKGYAFGNNLALRRICPLPDYINIPEPEQKCQKLHLNSEPQAKYVLLLNPDTVVPPDAFQKMYDFMEANPEAGVVGAKLVKASGKLDLACRRSFPSPSVSLWRMAGLSKLFPKNQIFGRYNLTFLDPDSLNEVDSVCGAFMWLRSAVIKQVGILDEAYFMYGEDLDWAFRIKEKGWKIFYNPVTTIIHYKGESSKQRSTGAIINFYQAMQIFYKKHYAQNTFFLLNWLIIFGIYSRGAAALFRNFLRPKTRRRVS